MLVYGLLIVPFSGLVTIRPLTDAYRAAFRRAGNVLFAHLGGGASATFEPIAAAEYHEDTRIVLRNRRVPEGKLSMDIKAAWTGYRPTAFLVALVVATPLPWRRRAAAMLWGLLGVHLFIVLRITLHLLNMLSDPHPLAAFSFTPFTKSILSPAARLLFLAPFMTYAAPAIIWLLVTFRRGDPARFLGFGRREAGDTPAPPR